jgi:hypothetical protein
MLKKFILVLFLLLIPISVDGDEIPEMPVLMQVSEGAPQLIVINMPFNHVGIVPNINVSKVQLIDRGATLGKDYVLSGVGMAHNVKTGDGIVVLELIMMDDSFQEGNESFTIIVDLGDRKLGGSVEIIDNDGI